VLWKNAMPEKAVGEKPRRHKIFRTTFRKRCYFLKRSSKARRASLGRAGLVETAAATETWDAAGAVSFSIVVRNS
jgi:hypothetical protein